MLDTVQTVKAKETAIPSIGLGTWQLSGDTCVDIVARALQQGYYHVDTAQAYENEKQVGEGIAKSKIERDQIFLTTKVEPGSLEPKALKASVEQSLKNLGTDYVNLLLLHWPSQDVSVEASLEALMEVQQKGQTLAIGVSNYPPSLLQKAHEFTKGAIVTNQVEYHPFLDQERLLAELRGFNMALTAYSPLARGKVFKEPVLIEIANHHKATPSQIALAWLLSQDKVIAIPKASSIEHAMDNLAAQNLRLSQEEIERISALGSSEGRLVNPPFAPDWEA